ncbi:MAG: TRAP transporter substrate-binding protein DctP, partial [Rubrivivax sp.]|nr:TRAP transporter substrate-binding protein DctP [Rubrivivax sp.]
MRRNLLKALFACALWGTAVAHAADAYVLKFATLAPQGSTWMKAFDAWGKELAAKSQGRLTVKFYPGGISGDEPDMLKKIRFGQLQGAALSGHGIGEIFPPARILEAPFLFRDHAEIDAARARIQPAIDAGFRTNRYELVAWMEVGNIHFFSTKPLASMDELARRRIWQWQGDRFIDAFFSVNGWSPVALPITEVYTGLSTGLVDTLISTPLASIALQWAGKTPYMSTQPMATGIGAVVVSSKFFDSLPADLQALLKNT